MNNPSISCQQPQSGQYYSEATVSQDAPLPAIGLTQRDRAKASAVPSQLSSAVTPLGQGFETRFIRAARPEDLSNIATLLSESFYPASGLINWLLPLLRLGIYQDLRGRLGTSSNRACLVAIRGDTAGAPDDDALAGTVEVAVRSPSAWSVPKSPYISNLAVKVDCRRQGIAQDLLLACEQTVVQWGFQDLYLHVLENNLPARDLYTKAGYHLHHIDPLWTTCLFKQPQRLLLHKRL